VSFILTFGIRITLCDGGYIGVGICQLLRMSHISGQLSDDLLNWWWTYHGMHIGDILITGE